MLNTIQQFIHKVIGGESLSADEAGRAFQIIFKGGATPAQIASLLTALTVKGEVSSEIQGAAQVMRARAAGFKAPPNALDTCGTGGDGSGSLNISTATAIVTAACGVPVVKHGNRSVSSKSGSADVLEALGVNLEASRETMQAALAACNLCFLMAPYYHPDMRHVSSVRKELGFRTLFNILGPLANPAQVSYQLLGVYSADLLPPMAKTLHALGTRAAWVVHGHGGLDELSITGPSEVAALREGEITRFTLNPQEIGLEYASENALAGGLPKDNALALERLLAGQPSAYRDAVCLNTAAALVVAGKASEMPEALQQARSAIDAGHARGVLNTLITITQRELKEESNHG